MSAPTVALLVRTRGAGAADRLGNPTLTYADPVRVPGCLLAPSSTQDLGGVRAAGTEATMVAHLPRGISLDLRGALVSADGSEWMRVVGDPQAYPAGSLPDGWPWGTQAYLARWEG